MIVKEAKVTNSNGDSITFGRHFYLQEGLNLSDLSATISYSQTTKDGANYQKTLLDIRNFSLQFYIDREFREDWWIEEKRAEAFRVFNPKHNPIRIDFETKAGKGFYINSELASIPLFVDDLDNDNESWLIGLLQFNASDPYIYSSVATVEDLAAWTAAFEFPLEILEEGIEMGYRNQSLMANVHNDGDTESGMLIRFRAIASVVNPKIVNVNTYEEYKLKFTMQAGDVIEASTHERQKTAILTRQNRQSNIFNAVDLNSKFLQLEPGDNLFRYDADEGIDNLEISIIFTSKRIGV